MHNVRAQRQQRAHGIERIKGLLQIVLGELRTCLGLSGALYALAERRAVVRLLRHHLSHPHDHSFDLGECIEKSAAHRMRVMLCERNNNIGQRIHCVWLSFELYQNRNT